MRQPLVQGSAVCSTSGRPHVWLHALPPTAQRLAHAAMPALSSDLQVPSLSRKALKEWAVTIAALRAGDQTILLRKGGIREPTFRPEADSFLLFPTAFHVSAPLLKEGVANKFAEAMALDPRGERSLQLGTYAQLTGAWTTTDPGILAALADQHVWTDALLDARLKWRGSQPLTVLEVRAWVLQPAAQLQLKEEHFGCFSWLDLSSDLPDTLSLQGATPALSDEDFAQRQAALRTAFQAVGMQPLPV